MQAHTYGDQRIVVCFNGRVLKTLQGIGRELKIFEVDLPPDAMAESNSVRLVLPEAKSVKSMGEGEDLRNLGVGVVWLEFAPGPPRCKPGPRQKKRLERNA
jgi:hypothetical protein